MRLGGEPWRDLHVCGGERINPLPKGASYLGFIFGRGPTPEVVEQALRQAHRELRITATPALPVL